MLPTLDLNICSGQATASLQEEYLIKPPAHGKLNNTQTHTHRELFVETGPLLFFAASSEAEVSLNARLCSTNCKFLLQEILFKDCHQSSKLYSLKFVKTANATLRLTN